MSQEEEPTMTELKQLLTRILAKMDGNEKEFSSLKQQVNTNKKDAGDNRSDINKLKTEVSRLKNIVSSNNIIIYGLEDSKEINENLENKITEILESVNLTIDQVDNYSRIGKKAGKRPIVLSLSSRRLKKNFFNNIDKIKSKGLNIANDISREEREKFKKFKEIQSELLNLEIESKIVRSKIIVGNKHFNLESAYKFLDEKKEREIHS